MDHLYQFCPVAKAAEILCEKWTLLILRELHAGSRHFNDLRRGIPRISPALLSKRLKALEEAGVIRKLQKKNNVYGEYCLTPSGTDTRPLIQQFGFWGKNYVKGKLKKEDLSAGLLLWDMHRRLNFQYFSDRRATLHFSFSDLRGPEANWWLVVEDQTADVCMDNPGYETDVSIVTTLPVMTDIWLGNTKLGACKKSDTIKLYGNAKYVKDMDKWLGLSAYAHLAKATPGANPGTS